MKLEIGRLGEQIAIDFLIRKNYKIVATNWRYRHWELDIIAIHKNILIFIEIKTRNKSSYAEDVTLVSKKQQKTLFKAASAYIYNNDYTGEFRFDVIRILLDREDTAIDHFEDAFFPDWH